MPEEKVIAEGIFEKIGLSEERVRACLPEIRKFVSFWRAYPDLFIDFL